MTKCLHDFIFERKYSFAKFVNFLLIRGFISNGGFKIILAVIAVFSFLSSTAQVTPDFNSIYKIELENGKKYRGFLIQQSDTVIIYSTLEGWMPYRYILKSDIKRVSQISPGISDRKVYMGLEKAFSMPSGAGKDNGFLNAYGFGFAMGWNVYRRVTVGAMLKLGTLFEEDVQNSTLVDGAFFVGVHFFTDKILIHHIILQANSIASVTDERNRSSPLVTLRYEVGLRLERSYTLGPYIEYGYALRNPQNNFKNISVGLSLRRYILTRKSPAKILKN